MALPNESKINWTANDGARLTDMNNIGKNLNHLEDVKYESGDSPTFTDVIATTETVTTANITTANITTLNMSGAMLPTTSPTEGFEAISSGNTWTPDRGYYVVGSNTAGDLEIEVFTSSAWYKLTGGTFLTDGTNVRVKNVSGGGLTAYYLKY